jgi:hypothetical protein
VSNTGSEFSKLTDSEYKKDNAAIWRELNRIVAILDGPPSPGLRDYVNNFITTFNAVEKTRHEENQQKLADISRKMGQRSFWTGLAGVSVALMALIVSIVGIMVGIWLHTHAGITPVQLFHNSMAPAVSWSRQSLQDVVLPASFAPR